MNASEMNPRDGSTNAGRENEAKGILAIDVGSSRVKLGWFPPPGECTSEVEPTLFPIAAVKLPQPEATIAIAHCGEVDLGGKIREWIGQLGTAEPQRFVASVHPEATAKVEEIFPGPSRMLRCAELPIEIHVDQPERVGIDRLLNAVAVNRLRQPQRPAIVVDLGTACTIDLISPQGAFEGGAILPGTALSSAALHSGTAALPLLTPKSFDKPPAIVGKSTQQAITAGLYWGLVGAVRELIERVACECSKPPQLFITGGEAARLVAHLRYDEESPRHIPNLVLAGIALVAEELS